MVFVLGRVLGRLAEAIYLLYIRSIIISSIYVHQFMIGIKISMACCYLYTEGTPSQSAC